MGPTCAPPSDTDRVIPIAILVGALIGRWWVVPATGLAWVVLLVAVGDLAASDVPVAALLAMANAAVGVVCHKLVALPLRRVRRRSSDIDRTMHGGDRLA